MVVGYMVWGVADLKGLQVFRFPKSTNVLNSPCMLELVEAMLMLWWCDVNPMKYNTLRIETLTSCQYDRKFV